MRRFSIALCAGVLLAVMCAAPALAQTQNNIAIVYRLLDEQTMAITNVQDSVRAGTIGALLNHGDLLTTDKNTRAAVRFTDDGSILRMNPNTDLQIRAEGDRTAMRKTLQVDFGELWARIQKQPEGAGYRIETPTAVAAVKGTEFFVRVDETGTTIITTEGVIEFFNDVGTVEIPAGFTGSVGTSATVAPNMAGTKPDEIASFGGIAEGEGPGAGIGTGGEVVEIAIPFTDAAGNQKTMIIPVPRAAAARYLPPALD
jgi:hypothetical protein